MRSALRHGGAAPELEKIPEGDGVNVLTSMTLQCKVNCMTAHTSRLLGNSAGFIAGAGIAAVDTLAFGGEVSPIVIVGMLLVISGAIGITWGSRGVVAAGLAWVWLPLAHVVKRAFGLPDTIQPNTYASILLLGIFSLAVTGLGLGFGIAVRRLLCPDAPNAR